MRSLLRLLSGQPHKPALCALPTGVRIYALSDVHGRADLLAKAQAFITQDAADFSGERVIEVYLGDYIDRGDDSRSVLELMTCPPKAGHTRICLKGNHEATLLAFLSDASVLRSWMNYGGLSTLASYGVNLPQCFSPESFETMRCAFREALPEAHLNFLQQLAIDYTLGDYFFVHAGVRPRRALAEQSEQDKLWIREPFLSYKRPFEKFIVHGHSPLAEAQIYSNRANLDANDASRDILPVLRLEGTEQTLFSVSGDGVE